MNSIARPLLALFLLATLGACTKEDPHPEERDPIFADLAKRAADSEKTAEESATKLKDLETALEKAEPLSLGKRDTEKEIAKTRAQNLQATQWALYYKIRTDRRKVVDSLAYKEAFGAHRPWPDPKEYTDYLTNVRLNEINLNWNVRVPKLQTRLPSTEGAKKAETKKEE